MMIQGHRNAVTELRWTGDGERIVTASSDKTARVWDAQVITFWHLDSAISMKFVTGCFSRQRKHIQLWNDSRAPSVCSSCVIGECDGFASYCRPAFR